MSTHIMPDKSGDISAGTLVRFIRGPLGVMRNLEQPYFEGVEHNVKAGDTGVLVGPHPTPNLRAEGWLVVEVGEFVCPCHESQFERVES